MYIDIGTFGANTWLIYMANTHALCVYFTVFAYERLHFSDNCGAFEIPSGGNMLTIYESGHDC